MNNNTWFIYNMKNDRAIYSIKAGKIVARLPYGIVLTIDIINAAIDNT